MKRQGRQAQRRDGRKQTMVWYDPALWERAQELGLFIPGSHTRGFGELVNRLLREEVRRVEMGVQDIPALQKRMESLQSLRERVEELEARVEQAERN